MKIFLIFFFWKAIKMEGSAQKKTWSVGLAETQVLFLGLKMNKTPADNKKERKIREKMSIKTYIRS